MLLAKEWPGLFEYNSSEYGPIVPIDGVVMSTIPTVATIMINPLSSTTVLPRRWYVLLQHSPRSSI